MPVKFSNNAVTTLSAGISVGATTFTVVSASTFPTLSVGDWTYITLTNEVVKITAISGTTFTCDATSAIHASGSSVELRMTAELLNDFAEDTEALPLVGGALTGAVTTTSTFDGRDVSTDGDKLDLIEASADVTDVTNVTAAGALMDSELAGIAAVKATTGTFLVADQTKLDGIETSATADQTAAEIRTAVEAATDSNVFTDADHTKLNTIETSATADQTNAEIKTAVEAATNITLGGSPTTTTQVESDDSTKVATTAYVTDKITTLIGGAPSTLNDLNELAAAINDDASYNSTLTTALGTKMPKAGGAFTGAVTTNSTFDGRDVATDGSKLDGIEAGATADQTGSQILALFSNSITAGHIAAGGVGASEIGNDVVNSQHYAAGSIDNEHLANDCVNANKIANDAINSEHYVNGSVDNVHISGMAASKLTGALPAIDGSNLTNLAIPSAEGTAVLSTGETGGTKYLREDGDGTSSWQAVAAGGASDIDGLTDGYNDASSVGLGTGALAADDGTANLNTAVGTNALNANTSGYGNTASGHYSLRYNMTGNNNVAVGSQACNVLTNTSNNTGIGADSLLNCVGTANAVVGYTAGKNITTGSYNTALGTDALEGRYASKLTGSYNIGIGPRASNFMSSGSENIGIGHSGLEGDQTSGLTGSYNTGIGYQTGYSLTTGQYNILNGYQAGYALTTGVDNVAIGRESLSKMVTRNEDTAIGSYAMKNGDQTQSTAVGSHALEAGGTTFSYQNTAVGHSAIKGVSSGSKNTAIGFQAGIHNNTGANNVFLGMNAGFTNTSGTDCLFVGYRSGYSETSSNKLHIANNSTESLIEGDFASKDLTVNGRLNVATGTVTTTATTAVNLLMFKIASADGAKVTVQVTDTVTTEVQISELLVTHNGVTIVSTQYGDVFTAAQLATFDVNIATTDANLNITTASANSTVYKISVNTL